MKTDTEDVRILYFVFTVHVTKSIEFLRMCCLGTDLYSITIDVT